MGHCHRSVDMPNLAFLMGPALVGLIAGISHGIVSHQADLPLSLTDQLLQPLANESWHQD